MGKLVQRRGQGVSRPLPPCGCPHRRRPDSHQPGQQGLQHVEPRQLLAGFASSVGALGRPRGRQLLWHRSQEFFGGKVSVPSAARQDRRERILAASTRADAGLHRTAWVRDARSGSRRGLSRMSLRSVTPESAGRIGPTNAFEEGGRYRGTPPKPGSLTPHECPKEPGAVHLPPEVRQDRGGLGPQRAVEGICQAVCAESVLMTSVRCPRPAHRRAVAAATVVLPTPPLPGVEDGPHAPLPPGRGSSTRPSCRRPARGACPVVAPG